MTRRAALLCTLLCLAAPPAKADARSEDMVRGWVESVDALPEWTAVVGSVRSEGDNTIAEGLSFTRSEPRIELEVERLRLLDLSEREGSGFVASEIELSNGTLRSDPVDYTVPSALISEIGMPNFAGVEFDTQRLMTSIAEFYGAAAEGELGTLTIPEMTAVQRQAATDGEAPTQSTVQYREIVTSGLRGGILRNQTFGPITISGVSDTGTALDSGIESVTADNLDLGALAHIFDPDRYRDGRGDGIWRPLMSRVLASGMTFNTPEGSLRMDSYAVENIDGRQPRRPMTAMWDRMMDPAIAQDVKNDLALEAVQTMFEAWRIGTFRLHGFSLEAPAEALNFGIETLTVSGLSEEGIDSILLKSLQGESPQGFGRLASFELAEFVFPDFEKLMEFAALEPDTDPRKHARVVQSSFAALPRIGQMSLSGFEAGLNESQAVSLGLLSVAMGDWNGMFAESGQLRLEGIEIPRSLLQFDPETTEILDTLGLDPLVFGISMTNRWSPEAGTDDGTWTLSLKDAADLELDYTINGLTTDWVTSAIAAAGQSEDSEAALIAMYSDLSLNDATVSITDRSLLDRAFAVAAKKQNLTVDGPSYRAQMRGALPFLLSAAVPAELSKLLSAPLQAFMEGGQTLVAEVTPPQPIPFPELVAAASRDPMALPAFLGLKLRSETPPN